MALTVRAAAAPAGKYDGVVYLGYSQVDGNFGRPAFRHTFDCGGSTVEKLTGVDPRAGTALIIFLESLFGRKFAPGEDIDPNLLIGQKFDIIVAAAAVGEGTQIVSVKPSAQ